MDRNVSIDVGMRMPVYVHAPEPYRQNHLGAQRTTKFPDLTILSKSCPQLINHYTHTHTHKQYAGLRAIARRDLLNKSCVL